MKEMVAKIVEMDRQARKLTDNAKAHKDGSQGEIEQSRKDIRQKYMNAATQKVKALRTTEEQLAAERWTEFSERSDKIVENLERSYKENGDKWVDEIVSRIIGS